MINQLLQNPDFNDSAPGKTLRRQPLGFVDAGARGGVHHVVGRLAGVTSVLAFEPDQEECLRLTHEIATNSPWANYSLEPIALAGKTGTAPLYVLKSAVNSSLRAPNPDFIKRYGLTGFEISKITPVPTTTLDALCFDPDRPANQQGEFIKLDTQSTESEILRGAERTLDERTVALLVEVEFYEIYKGQPLFSEVELQLRQRGFSFYGFDLRTRSAKMLEKRKSAGRERIFYADAIFFKDPLPGGLWKKPMSNRSWHVLFACALLLEHYDFALQLALETWARNEEAERLRRLVQEEASRLAVRAFDDAMALAERVRANPEAANVEVGKFVDARRHLADYDDVKA